VGFQRLILPVDRLYWANFAKCDNASGEVRRVCFGDRLNWQDKADVGDVRWCGNSHVPNLPEEDIRGALGDVRFQGSTGPRYAAFHAYRADFPANSCAAVATMQSVRTLGCACFTPKRDDGTFSIRKLGVRRMKKVLMATDLSARCDRALQRVGRRTGIWSHSSTL